jgi:hypothetical protein
MKIEKTYAAALALAGVLAVTATTPSFAKARAAAHADAQTIVQPVYQGDAADESVVLGHFAPGSTGYGRQAYNPEQPTDPDPRIGGALKMSTDR